MCLWCFRFLVEQGCIPPLCDLLTVMDSKIVQVALNGLENILRLGEQDSKFNNSVNPYSVMIEECYGGSGNRHILVMGLFSWSVWPKTDLSVIYVKNRVVYIHIRVVVVLLHTLSWTGQYLAVDWTGLGIVWISGIFRGLVGGGGGGKKLQYG